ncbi:TPA: hypothetical protein H1009_00570 [archaeon]|nr:hypothetical protein [Candidatus Naiadarchaeales archaeon SRR2090153.bin461]
MVYRTKEERIVIFKKAVTDAFGKDIYIELLNFFVKFMTERKRARGKKYTLSPNSAEILVAKLEHILKGMNSRKVFLKELAKSLHNKDWVLDSGVQIYTLLKLVETVLLHLESVSKLTKKDANFAEDYIEKVTKLNELISYLAILGEANDEKMKKIFIYFVEKEADFKVLEVEEDELQ